MLELAWLPLAWPLGSGAVLATATEEGSLSLINVAQVGRMHDLGTWVLKYCTLQSRAAETIAWLPCL